MPSLLKKPEAFGYCRHGGCLAGSAFIIQQIQRFPTECIHPDWTLWPPRLSCALRLQPVRAPVLRSPAAARAVQSGFGKNIGELILKADCGPMPESLHRSEEHTSELQSLRH